MQAVPWWAPVLGLAGVILGSLIVFFGNEWQRRKQGAASAQKEREAAYIALLVSSMAFVNRAYALLMTKRFRSGFVEWRDVTFGRRKPVDPMELYDFFSQDNDRLNEAWARIWAVGSQEAIDAADNIVAACVDLLDSSVATDRKGGWLLALAKGEQWTTGQEAAYQRALEGVAARRVAFAKVIRKETNRKAVQFALERPKGAALPSGSNELDKPEETNTDSS